MPRVSEARRANLIVKRVLERGELTRAKVCSFCGDAPIPGWWIVAHHENHDKPLDITWLCMSCHRRLHILRKSQPDASLKEIGKVFGISRQRVWAILQKREEGNND